MNDSVLQLARAQGRTVLTEVESKQLLAAAGIDVTPTQLATSPDQAVEIATALGSPVALKVVATAISHKSDIGGVRLNLADEAGVRTAYDEILAAAETQPGASPHEHEVDGVSVQPMAAPGVELMVGLARDPQFGPVVMFGLGGVLVEVLEDVAIRLVPLDRTDAAAMVREIKGFPVLQGYRGAPPVDLAAIEATLLAVSQFAADHPDIAELDLNPVIAGPHGAVAVDARIVLIED
jgi:acyl-CoA synthetase (NDP forming)